jgi:diketogulonate reductase-like aldo/keto reductase
MAAGTIPPAVNQAQFSALEYRRGLLDACQRRRGIVVEAYSPWEQVSTSQTRQ